MSEQTSTFNNPTNEAQTTLNRGRHSGGGNTLLSGEIKAEQNQVTDEALAEPIATDIVGNTDADDPTDAKAFTTTGAYPVNADRLQKDYSSPPIGKDRDTNI